MHQCRTPASHYSDFLEQNYPVLLAVLKRLARRHRLTRDETDELHSRLHLRLVQEDYAALRQFEGRSGFATYLTTVAERLRLDLQVSRWGKWRPSVEASRLGETASQLERLISRDRLSFDEACEILWTSHRVAESRAELERLRDQLPARRPRPAVLSLQQLEKLPVPVMPPTVHPDRSPAVRRALARALCSLPVADRRLVRLRFKDHWTVAKIARENNLDQKSAYRRFDAIYRSLRVSLTADGVDRDALIGVS
jgi:RNA polymerase sigma factor (sigma-70 family)